LNRYKPYADIVECSAGEMKEKIAENTATRKRKLSVLLDESTLLSGSAMSLDLEAFFQEEHLEKAHVIKFDLMVLESKISE
jgi:hypothetical protein